MKKNISLYKKNIRFFKKNKGEIFSFISEYLKLPINIYTKENLIYVSNGKDSYTERIGNPFKDVSLISLNISNNSDNEAKKYIHTKIVDKIFPFSEKFRSDKRKIKDFILQEKYIPVILFNGLGTGLSINSILQLIDTEYIIIIEPKIFNLLASFYFIDWEELFDKYKIYFILGNLEEEIINGLYQIFSSLNPILVTQSLGITVYDTNVNVDEVYTKSILLSYKGWGFYDDEKIAIQHSSKNLKEEIPYLYKPSNVNTDLTAVIVGSGPSLDADIETIKQIQDKAIIFSCGTALHKLYKEGILPDFHVELERPEFRVSLFEDLPRDYTSKITLLAADVIPTGFHKIFGKSLIFPRESSVHTFILKPRYISPFIAPTVANTATSLALTLGFNNILYFGVDLGYISSEKKHAKGTIYTENYKHLEYKDDNKLRVKGNFRDFVYTNDILLWAKDNLEKLIKLYPDRNFYNASDGAFIEGSKPIKREDIFNQLSLYRIDKEYIINNLHENFSTNYEDIFNIEQCNYYKESLDLLDEVISVISKLSVSRNTKEIIQDINYVSKDIFENISPIAYILLSGTIKTIVFGLYRFLWLTIFSNQKDLDTLKQIAISGLEDIKKDLENLKMFLDLSDIDTKYNWIPKKTVLVSDNQN